MPTPNKIPHFYAHQEVYRVNHRDELRKFISAYPHRLNYQKNKKDRNNLIYLALVPALGKDAWGVFAQRKISKNTKIGRFVGTLCSDTDQVSYNNGNLFKLGDTLFLDANNRCNFTRFFNHADAKVANVCAEIISGKYIHFKALRDIKAREQLLIDYGDDYFHKLEIKIVNLHPKKEKQDFFSTPPNTEVQSVAEKNESVFKDDINTRIIKIAESLVLLSSENKAETVPNELRKHFTDLDQTVIAIWAEKKLERKYRLLLLALQYIIQFEMTNSPAEVLLPEEFKKTEVQLTGAIHAIRCAIEIFPPWLNRALKFQEYINNTQRILHDSLGILIWNFILQEIKKWKEEAPKEIIVIENALLLTLNCAEVYANAAAEYQKVGDRRNAQKQQRIVHDVLLVLWEQLKPYCKNSFEDLIQLSKLNRQLQKLDDISSIKSSKPVQKELSKIVSTFFERSYTATLNAYYDTGNTSRVLSKTL